MHKLAPINRELILKEKLFKKIDEWHLKNKDKTFNKKDYKEFLNSISYFEKEKEDFKIETNKVDKEISSIAGPQLVVPVDNARYALNAANARWGSLYDALYGTDVIPGDSKGWNNERASKVITYVRNFLNENFPLNKFSWNEVSKIQVDKDKLTLLKDSEKDYLKNNDQFIGYNGDKNNPSSILIKNNNLHIDILIDSNHMIGKIDKAHISDVIIESAISTIIDNEDSVAAVDANDKVNCYRNWLGLMKGNLTANFTKNGKKFIRKLNPNRNYISKDGKNKFTWQSFAFKSKCRSFDDQSVYFIKRWFRNP